MRGMHIAAAAFILAWPAMGSAATPEKPAAAAKSAAAPAKSATPPGATQVPIKRVQMSQEGNAIVTRINASPDVRLQQIQVELRGMQQQNLQFVTGGPVDVDKLDASLRRESALIGEARNRANDRLLMILRALSESDRIAYLQRSISVTRLPNAANPAKPPAGKPVAVAPPAATTPAPAPASAR